MIEMIIIIMMIEMIMMMVITIMMMMTVKILVMMMRMMPTKTVNSINGVGNYCQHGNNASNKLCSTTIQ